MDYFINIYSIARHLFSLLSPLYLDTIWNVTSFSWNIFFYSFIENPNNGLYTYSVVKMTLKFNCINVTHVICFWTFHKPLNWIVTNNVWVFSRLWYFYFVIHVYIYVIECRQMDCCCFKIEDNLFFFSLIGEIYATSHFKCHSTLNNYFNFGNTFKKKNSFFNSSIDLIKYWHKLIIISFKSHYN